MIDRREFVQGATVALLAGAAGPVTAGAGPTAPRRCPYLGILGESNPIGWVVRADAVEIECRWADEHREGLPGLAAELVALNVDIIVSAGTRALQAARNATKTIPIVFVSSGGSAEDTGLSRRAGNVTGLRIPSDIEIVAQRLKLLRHVVPGLTRLAVLGNPANPSHRPVFKSMSETIQSQGVEVRLVEARRAEDLAGAFATMTRERVGGFLVLPDALFAIHGQRLVSLATENRLPAAYSARSFAEVGGLMALHGDMAEVIRRIAALVARILGGEAPASLPVECLTHLELTVNVRAAQILGITLSPSLLARADAIIRS